MERYLKEYQAILHTAGPVFVGSGKEIGKKEHLFLSRNLVGIPDMQKLYQEMKRRGKAGLFEEYLLKNNRDDLKKWLMGEGIKPADIKSFLRYTLRCDELIMQKGKRLQIMACIKDAYGKPYIPGTSLKGMLRTILLAEDILQKQDVYRNEKRSIVNVVNDMQKVSRTACLKREASCVEAKMYRTLNREDTKPQDAVNDCLQGLVVSDSEPLSETDLVLCQSIEKHTDGVEKSLPLLRECIKPGCDIKFSITVDTRICPISREMLMQAVRVFGEQYYQNFAAAFSGEKKPDANSVLLGGGCGFVSKTVIYPLYGKKEGQEVTKKIFRKTGVPMNHKHDKDIAYGASPHILKCTHYKGKTMKMGLCELMIEEV